MSALRQPQIPYILTILFGILAWIITHIVDGLTTSPFLVYSVATHYENNKEFRLTYTIENITRDKNIDQIDFFLVSENGNDSIIKSATVNILPPFKLSDGDYVPAISNLSPTYKLHLSNFQPECSIIMELNMTKNEILPLRFTSKTPVLFQKNSWKTCFVKNEIQILILLSIITILLIIISLNILK